MEKIFSKNKPKELLHIIVRASKIRGRKFISKSSDFLQLSPIKLNTLGKICKPHVHLYKKVDLKKIISQEIWIIVKGRMKILFYDNDKKYICHKILKDGDCSLTLSGGHCFESLQKNTIAYEIKSGPYLGRKLDKEEF
jgi:hypothetical protein